MEELFKRVQKDLDNNWPVDKKDIEELLILARIASDTLSRIACSDSPYQAPSNK